MYLSSNRISISFVFLLLTLPDYSYADEVPQNSANSPCYNAVYRREVTPYSVVTFGDYGAKASGSIRWICVGDNLILKAGRDDSSFQESKSEGLRNEGKLVKRLGEAITLRMVINESAGSVVHHSYWLLDFRNKDPLLVGPMVSPEYGGPFSVIWHDANVIVIFHSVGGTQSGRFDYQPNWGKEERKFVPNVVAETLNKVFLKDSETREEITIQNLPLMNKDGVFHPGKRNYINMPHDRLLLKGKVIPSSIKKGEDKVKKARNIFPGYHYDYKTKKLTAIAIEED